ncbi:hypothetical protein [Singulisphaera sp. PoT]|uniref:hypothetical protein n=1 Tax=Singulisphaera sp. PoT TaxID=3411797 RepID=UPI003BF5DA9E
MLLLQSIYDMILSRSPETLIVAILAALTISLPAAGIFALMRKKSAEPGTLVIGLMTATNVGAMLLAAGFIWSEKSGGVNASPNPGGQIPGSFGPGTFLAPMIMRLADTDQDGRILPEEAARAAQQFISQAGNVEAVALDQEMLAEAINKGMGVAMANGAHFGHGGDRNRGGHTFSSRTFAIHDPNHDGQISRDEALDFLDRLYDESHTEGGHSFSYEGLERNLRRMMRPPNIHSRADARPRAERDPNDHG